MLLLHGLSQSPSLRQTHARLAACPDLLALAGLRPGDAVPAAVPLSLSQLCAANHRRRPGFLAALLPALRQRVGSLGACGPGWPELVVLDSTFLPLSRKLAPWLPPRQTKRNQGLRLQTQYRPALDLPEHLRLSDTRQNDCTGGLDAGVLDDPTRCAALRGQTLVCDLGYYSHTRFAQLRAAGIHFVSRVQPQARVTVREQRPVQRPLALGTGGRIQVEQDARVDVGSPNRRRATRLAGLRLVVATVAPSAQAARQGQTPLSYRLLTDRWDLSAAEVVQAYLWRWQIELFFKWLKSHVHLRHLLGYSHHAVVLSVWLVCVLHLLTVLAARAAGQLRRSPQLLALLGLVLLQLAPADLADATTGQLPFPDLQLAMTLPP